MQCANCRYDSKSKLHYANPAVRLCDSCQTRFVWETKRAVEKHRPTFQQVESMILEVVKSAFPRIAELEREVTGLKQAVLLATSIQTRTKTRTALAREMLASGMRPAQVAAELGWSAKQVRKVKARAFMLDTPAKLNADSEGKLYGISG